VSTIPTKERPDDHPVRRAIAALKRYAGHDMTRDTCNRILPDWEDYDTLSANDIIEITFAFPLPAASRPLRGGGMASGSMIMPGAES
jgi:hypothetical protein